VRVGVGVGVYFHPVLVVGPGYSLGLFLQSAVHLQSNRSGWAGFTLALALSFFGSCQPRSLTSAWHALKAPDRMDFLKSSGEPRTLSHCLWGPCNRPLSSSCSHYSHVRSGSFRTLSPQSCLVITAKDPWERVSWE